MLPSNISLRLLLELQHSFPGVLFSNPPVILKQFIRVSPAEKHSSTVKSQILLLKEDCELFQPILSHPVRDPTVDCATSAGLRHLSRE